MAKKPSGLGRGLGDLLEDNSLEVRNRGNVVLRGDAKASSEAPAPSVVVPPLGCAPKSLYEEKPRWSIKANFKNQK